MPALAIKTPTETVPLQKNPAWIRLYRQMLLIRLCEERLAKSHQRGLIPGVCHTYVGQEAIAVGVCAELNKGDMVFSTHRGHGHALAKGLEPRQLFAELYGRATGCSRGRGGSIQRNAGAGHGPGVDSPETRSLVQSFFHLHLKDAAVKVEALSK
jgi:TPP-dependent pyruvate/acetoin dehydrogenase alpha subunit